MAREIIVLEQDTSHADAIRFRAVFWLLVPADRQTYYANASFASQVKDGSVTAGELTALQNGSTLEAIREFGYPNGTTLAAIEADLQVQYTAAQSALTNMTGQFATQTLTHYGSYYDGTTWTVKAIT